MLRTLLRLLPAHAAASGRVEIAGRDVLAMGRAELLAHRGRTAAMVFQEPLLAFDPVVTVGRQIAETIVQHEACSWNDARRRALELFERVRIPTPAARLDAYPHEMSGGMLQRAMIALALSCRPRLLLADEPTTALDATVQIQILLLLRELQEELGMAMIFVTHDIGAAVEVSDRIGVMQSGRLLEIGDLDQVIRRPSHEYTRSLLGAARARTRDTRTSPYIEPTLTHPSTSRSSAPASWAATSRPSSSRRVAACIALRPMRPGHRGAGRTSRDPSRSCRRSIPRARTMRSSSSHSTKCLGHRRNS
jgi:peptide/nickel transport system ATP-binding protein